MGARLLEKSEFPIKDFGNDGLKVDSQDKQFVSFVNFSDSSLITNY